MVGWIDRVMIVARAPAPVPLPADTYQPQNPHHDNVQPIPQVVLGFVWGGKAATPSCPGVIRRQPGAASGPSVVSSRPYTRTPPHPTPKPKPNHLNPNPSSPTFNLPIPGTAVWAQALFREDNRAVSDLATRLLADLKAAAQAGDSGKVRAEEGIEG